MQQKSNVKKAVKLTNNILVKGAVYDVNTKVQNGKQRQQRKRPKRIKRKSND